ncbi:MAG: hemerythrin domain-containing protein [Kofleriaceae bacterium]
MSSSVSLGEFCTKRPLAVPALARLGVELDDPARALASVYEQGHLDEKAVDAAICAEEEILARAWCQPTITEQIDAIVSRYHQSFPLEALAVEDAFARGLPIWETALALLDELHRDFAQHVEMEERVLFPLLRLGGSSVLSSIRALSLEHEDLILNLLALGAVVRGCIAATPELAAELTNAFGRFERFLCESIHVESNVLFPRALELARR